MPEGFIAWAISLFVITTLLWAAVWWWLPALFRDRDRDVPSGGDTSRRSRGSAERQDAPRDPDQRT